MWWWWCGGNYVWLVVCLFNQKQKLKLAWLENHVTNYPIYGIWDLNSIMAVWLSWYIIACLVHVILLELWVQSSLLDNFLHLYTTCSNQLRIPARVLQDSSGSTILQGPVLQNPWGLLELWQAVPDHSSGSPWKSSQSPWAVLRLLTQSSELLKTP